MPVLNPRQTPGSQVIPLPSGGWRLEIPAGPAGRYRLAQLDDYSGLSRRDFPWHPPVSLTIACRASGDTIPGTWGFGFWNDPFSLSLGFGGTNRFPTLPNAAWFFFASPPNYLSVRDDLPAQGGLSATFQSKPWNAALIALGAPLLPLLALPPLARLLRRFGRRIVKQDAANLPIDPMEWHNYQLEWDKNGVTFCLDGRVVLQSSLAPFEPLGLVIWLDNQYAAWPPTGRLSFGTLANSQAAWIELSPVTVR